MFSNDEFEIVEICMLQKVFQQLYVSPLFIWYRFDVVFGKGCYPAILKELASCLGTLL
jgi:hypothetical protein